MIPILIEKDGLSYELDKSNLTAKLVNSQKTKMDILIPRSVRYQSQDYIITSIGQKAFKNNQNIRSIDFTEDSELQIIGSKAFRNSSIQKITIPSKFELFEEDWCLNAKSLNYIYLSPKNTHFKYLDENKTILLGKSNQSIEKFDVIIFASRSIQKVTIPSNIKKIGRCSFDSCNLKEIKFEEKSSLEIIEEHSFSSKLLEKIEIPPSVKILKDGWINYISVLHTDVIISSDNPNFKNVDNSMILGKSDSNSDEFDTIVCGYNGISDIVIPSSIKYINCGAFNYCTSIISIVFQPNSKLISIGNYAFCLTSISEIKIPSSCQKIGKGAFYLCINLSEIELLPDSQLKSFPKLFAAYSRINKLTITKNIEKLESGWCANISKLNDILISSENHNFSYLNEDHKVILGKSNDQKDDVFDSIVFANRDITDIEIPPTIKYICSWSFCNCINISSIDIPSSIIEISSNSFHDCYILQTINIPENSQLKRIGNHAFIRTSLKKLFLPPQLDEIIFNQGTEKIEEITVSSENKNFKYLNEDKNIIVGKKDQLSNDFDIILFANRNTQNVLIPASIKYIGEYAFTNCDQLNEFNFEKNSQLILIDENAFCYSNINHLILPSHLKYIGPFCFSNCNNLSKIEFEPNSELSIFESYLFNRSSIEYLSFPSNLKELKPGWCSETSKLKNIFIQPGNKNFSFSDDSHKIVLGKNNNNDNYDSLVFADRFSEEIIIPSSVINIESYSFSPCKINKIFIPKNVTKIDSFAFYECKKVQSITFDDDCNLNSVAHTSFSFPLIKYIRIPKKMKEFSFFAFRDCDSLKSIEFLSDEIELIEELRSGNVCIISFPNVHLIKMSEYTVKSFNESLVIYIAPNSSLNLI